jgi:hypothetical protein
VDDVAAADREGGPEDDDSDDGEGENDTTHAKQRGRREDSVGYEEPEEEEQAMNDALDEEPSEDDETYGGSPKPSRNTTPEPSDGDADEELLVPTDEASEIRKDRIINTKGNSNISDFVFDDRKGAYAEITFEFPASTPKLLMLHHVEDTASFATIHVIPGITSAVYVAKPEKKDDPPHILTAGSNLLAMREYNRIIDVNRLFTNDIVSMLHLYGVEACRATIVREIHTVFSGHGISVDFRHLGLVADTMTKGGGFSPFNRNGMRSNVSPFMKMSFETTVGFLKDAVLERDWDDLKNPSARIVVGKLGGVGTGAFDVLAPVKVVDPLKEEDEDEDVQDIQNAAKDDSEEEVDDKDEDEIGDVMEE